MARKKRPSERKGHYTEARYRAWDKANKKRAEKNKKITHGIVYKLTSPSGKSYVGISKYSIARRILWHKSEGSCCHAIKAAIKKYGFKNFKKEVLHSNVLLSDLPDLEVKEIASHQTLAPNGYNLTKGGEYNPMDEPATRMKISKAKKQYWKDAGQERRNQSAMKMQENGARERATNSKLSNAERRWREKASHMSPEAAEKFLKFQFAERKRRQLLYQEKKRASQHNVQHNDESDNN